MSDPPSAVLEPSRLTTRFVRVPRAASRFLRLRFARFSLRRTASSECTVAACTGPVFPAVRPSSSARWRPCGRDTALRPPDGASLCCEHFRLRSAFPSRTGFAAPRSPSVASMLPPLVRGDVWVIGDRSALSALHSPDQSDVGVISGIPLAALKLTSLPLCNCRTTECGVSQVTLHPALTANTMGSNRGEFGRTAPRTFPKGVATIAYRPAICPLAVEIFGAGSSRNCKIAGSPTGTMMRFAPLSSNHTSDRPVLEEYASMRLRTLLGSAAPLSVARTTSANSLVSCMPQRTARCLRSSQATKASIRPLTAA